MIVTDCVYCKTCEEKYLLRVGIGLEQYHLHSYDCQSCGLPISIAVRVSDSGDASFEGVENVVFSDGGINILQLFEQEATVINLHPFFAFSAEQIHDRRIFTSIEYGRKIWPHLRVLPGKKVQDIEHQFNVPNASNLWTTVKNLLLLEKNRGKTKNIQKTIRYYEDQRRKYISDTSVTSPKEVTLDFFDSLFHPRFEQLSEPAINFVRSIKDENSTEFQRFLIFYNENLESQHFKQYISVFSDYFKIYPQLGQIVVHARISDENVDEKIVGSKCFEDVKLYYGQAYETLTSSFVIFACLNNIHSGRSYDQFNSMTLNKYMKDVSKEKKANPFLDVQAFTEFTDGLDSTLRNGSHHASIWRDGEKVFYRSGGTGAQREMPFSRYLHLCNKLTIALAAMFKLELEIKVL